MTRRVYPRSSAETRLSYKSPEGTTSFPRLSAVERAEHQNGVAFVSILKDVGSTERLEDDLAVLFTVGYRAT